MEDVEEEEEEEEEEESLFKERGARPRYPGQDLFRRATFLRETHPRPSWLRGGAAAPTLSAHQGMQGRDVER